jgi:UDP-N-acetylglucosamine 2-epimerase (non-hydrolysing)
LNAAPASGAVCFVVGARPNFVKSAPVIRALDELGVSTNVIHTGQHYDRQMSDVFLSELGLPTPSVSLGIGSGSHAEQTARALVGVESVLADSRPALVVVPGDVNSTLAGALAAVKLQIPVCHLEAGLRSYDDSMPEEHNRRLTDHVSSLLLVHSESAIANLERESVRGEACFVGNTMIDSLLAHVGAARAAEPWAALRIEPHSYALVTLHRPSLVDDERLLGATVRGLVELSRALPVVLPVHPRTRSRLEATGLSSMLESSDVIVSEPLSYLAFIGLMAEAAVVVTDSGGVQEETSALGVRCFTLRDSTERPVTVELGTNTILGARPERIADVPDLLATPKAGQPIPLWDGSAGPRAAREVVRFLDEDEVPMRVASAALGADPS